MGSEMCIRDSDKANQWRWRILRSGKVLVSSEAYSRRGGCRRTACLLYTSDAADDLLCVDLGGRRIIKQKNVQHHPY